MEPNLSSDPFGGDAFGAPLGAGSNPLAPGLGQESCQPLDCDKAMNCIDGARDPMSSPLDVSGFRGQLADCAPCLQAFDLEVKLRGTMTPTASELPSPDLAMRITETLASIDLSQIDISDL